MNDIDKTRRTGTGKTWLFTVIALIVGAFIGAAAESHVRAASAMTPNAQTSAAPAASATANATPLNESTTPQQPLAGNWNPFQEMRDMQRQMNRMFEHSLAQFSMSPQMDIFKQRAGYTSSLDVLDLKNHYEIHAYLPDANVDKAQVKLDGNQLTVQVSGQQSQTEQGRNATASTEEWGSYDQTVQLAGNLKDNDMKIQREPHELLITIPKANS